MFDQLIALATDLPFAADGRWFWLVGLIAFGGCAMALRTVLPSRRAEHQMKDYDRYIDDLLTTNGSRVRRDDE